MSAFTTTEAMEPHEPTKRMQAAIRILRAALPATTHNDISNKMTEIAKDKYSIDLLDAHELRNYAFLPHDICGYLKHVRQNAELYGWTVPHAKRGSANTEKDDTGAVVYTKADENRFFVVPLNKAEPLDFKDREDITVFTSRANQGLKATLRTIVRMNLNEALAIQSLGKYEAAGRKRELMKIVRGLNYLADMTEEYLRDAEGFEERFTA